MKYLLSLLFFFAFAPVAIANPGGGADWNPEKRFTTITLHGLPSNTSLDLFVPAYKMRVIGETDSCNILTANAKKFPLRPGDGGWQSAWAGGKTFYWYGGGSVNDPAPDEPKCVNGQLQGVDPGSWKVWINGSTIRYYDVNSGFTPNTRYATVFNGNWSGVNSGRSLSRAIKSNVCGVAKFKILEFWDGDLSTSIGQAFSYVPGYQVKQGSAVLYTFNPGELQSVPGALCKNGTLFLPR